MLKKESRNVNIPKQVVIPCPKVDFKNRYAHKCRDCEYFDGLGIMRESDIAFSEKYAVRCSHVIERRTMTIEVVE